MCCGVARIVADAPRSREGCTLFGRLVQMQPPRRLGSALKLALRTAIGLATVLSIINSRSSVFLAAWRVGVLLIVTRTLPPALMSMLMVSPPKSSSGVYQSGQ